jgi:hypothetical protein
MGSTGFLCATLIFAEDKIVHANLQQSLLCCRLYIDDCGSGTIIRMPRVGNRNLPVAALVPDWLLHDGHSVYIVSFFRMSGQMEGEEYDLQSCRFSRASCKA